jgi:N-acylneuraminate cytidylyltransferase
MYAIIPARGGSKGIPNKNLCKVGRKSLIEIGINTCRGSDRINKVFVSTDHNKIMSEANKFGAEIIIRPENLSGDTDSSESALLHALDDILKRGFEKPEAILFYQVTNPFTTSEDLNNACEYFIKSKADSLFTASLFTRFLWKREEGKLFSINHDYTNRPRRQDISNCFLENGAFYIINTDGFIKYKHRFFGKIEMFEMSSINTCDIDEPQDLKIANLMLKFK